MQDWINHSLQCGEADVYCKTCESHCEFNRQLRLYECECDFGAPIAALAFGLEGYWVDY